MSDNKYFTCGFCGAEYSKLEDRMDCERRCNENKRMELENERHNQLLKKSQKLIDEINEFDTKIEELKKTRNEKYTEYREIFGYHTRSIYRDKGLNDLQIFKNIFGI